MVFSIFDKNFNMIIYRLDHPEWGDFFRVEETM